MAGQSIALIRDGDVSCQRLPIACVPVEQDVQKNLSLNQIFGEN
ncbi:Uncharacterised protein [uncultured archaeon]|nr:Uncharacterised protein [uncultured archaeon]